GAAPDPSSLVTAHARPRALIARPRSRPRDPRSARTSLAHLEPHLQELPLQPLDRARHHRGARLLRAAARGRERVLLAPELGQLLAHRLLARLELPEVVLELPCPVRALHPLRA